VSLSFSLDEGLDNITEPSLKNKIQYKSSNNSDPSLFSNGAELQEKAAPVELDDSHSKVQAASAAKLRTQSECDPTNNSKENMPSFNSLDNLFANVASRTEALASKSGSFNLVKTRPAEKS